VEYINQNAFLFFSLMYADFLTGFSAWPPRYHLRAAKLIS